MVEASKQATYSQQQRDFPRSRIITAVAVFAALAIALQLSPLKIPAPYAPFLIYAFWEIPIFAAFILYGARVGVTVAIINFLSLLVIFPGQLQAGPIYNLLAIFAMMLGIVLAYRIAAVSSKIDRSVWPFWLALILGSFVRTVVMTFVNALLLPMPPPLGFNAPIESLEKFLGLPPGTMFLFLALFNTSVALYTLPISYVVSKAVSGATRIPPRYGR